LAAIMSPSGRIALRAYPFPSVEDVMRQLLLSPLALLIALAASTPARAQDKESAECKAIIDQALKAQGGADKIASLKAFTAKAKGTINAMEMNLDFTLEVFSQPPDKSKAVIDVNVGGMQLQIVQIFNGNKGWISVLGMVKDAEKEEIEEHLAQV